MKLYKRKLWAGFRDGRLHLDTMDTGWGGFGSGDGMRKVPALYTSRREAREQYRDVRQIEIRELRKAKK